MVKMSKQKLIPAWLKLHGVHCYKHCGRPTKLASDHTQGDIICSNSSSSQLCCEYYNITSDKMAKYW